MGSPAIRRSSDVALEARRGGLNPGSGQLDPNRTSRTGLTQLGPSGSTISQKNGAQSLPIGGAASIAPPPGAPPALRYPPLPPMLHYSLRSTAVAAIAAILSVPAGATSAQAPAPFNQHNTAKVEVTHGSRGAHQQRHGMPETIRKGDREGTVGRSQLEIPTGSEARISWPGTCSVRIYGPSSIEWDSQDSTIGLKFHELAWADFECREGQHEVFLPSEWSGTFGRSAFHIRGITGGPCELRLQAGEPVLPPVGRHQPLHLAAASGPAGVQRSARPPALHERPPSPRVSPAEAGPPPVSRSRGPGAPRSDLAILQRFA